MRCGLKPAMLRDLAVRLVDQRRHGRRVLIVIDEAQNLSYPALEELRMLSNLETETSKLMQIVLSGQPELRERLASPELDQLSQRITVRYHLMPLDSHDTHSTSITACGKPPSMSPWSSGPS